MFPFAPSPDIYRSTEKDDALLSRLRDDINDVALQWGGQRWSGRHAEVDLLAGAAYFGLTQLRAQPSLGEEYCDIRQVTQIHDRTAAVRRVRERKVGGETAPPLLHPLHAPPSFDLVLPSRQRRVALYVLQVLAPYAYAKAKRQQQQAGLMPIPASISSSPSRRLVVALSRAWQRVLSVVPLVDGVLPHLQRFHLALFFLTGHYLSLPHRLTSSRYIAVRPPEQQQRASYTALGLLLLLQLAVVAAIKARQGAGWAVDWWRQERGGGQLEGAVGGRDSWAVEERRRRDEQEREEEVGGVEDATARQCILHLGSVRDPTATECGHVFCWYCITECCKQKPECPLCRAPAALENLLCLHHYQ